MAKRILALDLDGTLAADPKMWQSLCNALRDSGKWEVHVVTAEKSEVGDGDYKKRKAQLKDLGFDAYDDLMIVGPPVAENKAAYLRTVNASILLDNRSENCFVAYADGVAVGLYANPKMEN